MRARGQRGVRGAVESSLVAAAVAWMRQRVREAPLPDTGSRERDLLPAFSWRTWPHRAGPPRTSVAPVPHDARDHAVT